MSRERMEKARELIMNKQYDEARAILRKINHPVARKWLANIDIIAPSRPASLRKKPASPTRPPARRQAATVRQRSNNNILTLFLGAIVVFLAAFIVVLALSANAPPEVPTGAGDITAPIYNFVEAANQEDLAIYMSTIHTQNPGYGETEVAAQELFDTYDLSYEVSALVIISRTSTEARVSFVMTTRKINGPNFRDNEVTGVYVLRPEDGRWKIFGQEINPDVYYFN